MRILFYFVHPAKFHLFKNLINVLKKNNEVDVIIKNKDVLEELIKDENWNYYNLFPKLKIDFEKRSVIRSAIMFCLSVLKLELYLIRRKKYDLFITDDALVVNGRLRKILTIKFTDNDYDTLKFAKILFYFADYIISPIYTNLGKFKYKQIGFKGNKALAYLHPKYFTPNCNVLKKYNLVSHKFIILRISKLNAIHDNYNVKGITEESIKKIVELYGKDFKIIISAEKVLNKELEKFLFKGNPKELIHIMAFADLFIGDSGTMATEASMLGVPNILVNKLALRTSLHIDLIKKDLQICLKNDDELLEIINKILKDKNYKSHLKEKLNKYISESEDFNEFFLKKIEEIINVKKNFNSFTPYR